MSAMKKVASSCNRAATTAAGNARRESGVEGGDRVGELGPVQIVDGRAGGDGAGELPQNVRQQMVVEMELDDPPVLAPASELEQHRLWLDADLESRFPAEAAHIDLVGKIDGDLGFVGNRLHVPVPFACCRGFARGIHHPAVAPSVARSDRM